MPDGLTVTLPPDLAALVAAKVESGEYASAEEVVRAGLLALAPEGDDAPAEGPEVEAWLRRDVLPTLERMEQDPGRGIPLREVAERLRAKMRG